MLPHAFLQVVCDSGVQDGLGFVGEDVDVELSDHGGRLSIQHGCYGKKLHIAQMSHFVSGGDCFGRARPRNDLLSVIASPEAAWRSPCLEIASSLRSSQ